MLFFFKKRYIFIFSFKHFSSVIAPPPSSALHASLSSLLLSRPTPVPRSFSFSPPQRGWVRVCLSGEERWVLPYQILFQTNPSSEKHVCHQRADAGLFCLFFFFSFLSGCGSLHAARRDECESKTNKWTKGKETFYPRSLPYHVRKHEVSKGVFPRLYMIYINVRKRKTTTHRDEQTCAHRHTCTRMTRSFCSVCLSGLSGNDGSTNTLRERSAAGRGGMNYTSGLSPCIKQKKKRAMKEREEGTTAISFKGLAWLGGMQIAHHLSGQTFGLWSTCSSVRVAAILRKAWE